MIQGVAVVCLLWYTTVVVVCFVGYFQIKRHYSRPPTIWASSTDMMAGPDVTIIRPVKGLEPALYDCLASTFRVHYPPWKLYVRFCISSRSDPALPVLEQLLRDFPDFPAQILVEEEDEALQNGSLKLGPNPKIRNMSRAYREAPRRYAGVVWIIDCNVWVGRHSLGRMLSTLGRNQFVHQLPLVVDTTGTPASLPSETRSRIPNGLNKPLHSSTQTFHDYGGGRLEEMFLSTSHAKFYTAINTVLLAPCIIGKSTMFNLKRLDSLTQGQGIDYFSNNICEDHLIGELFWKSKPEQMRNGKKMGKHGLCFGDLAIQPMSDMSVKEYWDRRVRWLRVRKFTVTLATLVEPGTESFLCSLYGAFAFTTLPFFRDRLGIPQSWLAFFAFWLLSVSIWCIMDWRLYRLLQSGASIHVDEHTPAFARPPPGQARRKFKEWLVAWLGREGLALPIWFWAFWGGTSVEWRGKKFRVGVDMRVHEIAK